VREFLDDPRSDKRSRLVDRLLDSPAYVAHFTNIELRRMIPEVDSSLQARFLVPGFEAWLREQVAANAGSDRIVREILRTPAAEDALLNPVRELPDRREAAIPGTEKVVPATFLDGNEPQWEFRVPARVTLANWITSPDNPYFARATANRMWAQLFGIGLVDP